LVSRLFRFFSNVFAKEISPGSYTNLRLFTKIIAIANALSKEVSKTKKQPITELLFCLKGFAFQQKNRKFEESYLNA
jgi:hypothetical protein